MRDESWSSGSPWPFVAAAGEQLSGGWESVADTKVIGRSGDALPGVSVLITTPIWLSGPNWCTTPDSWLAARTLFLIFFFFFTINYLSHPAHPFFLCVRVFENKKRAGKIFCEIIEKWRRFQGPSPKHFYFIYLFFFVKRQKTHLIFGRETLRDQLDFPH